MSDKPVPYEEIACPTCGEKGTLSEPPNLEVEGEVEIECDFCGETTTAKRMPLEEVFSFKDE